MEPRFPPPADDSPDEESEMSFPASDPPSYGQPSVGEGDGDEAEETGTTDDATETLRTPDADTGAPGPADEG